MKTKTPLVLACFVVASLAAPAPASGAGFVYERVLVPMRDGVKLSVDIWRPDDTEVKAPVIATITPYHALYKALDRAETDLPNQPADGIAQRLVPKGYAYAMADVRGTYNSGGCWDYGGIKERQDGYDLVEWLGTQKWSNGKVALTGGSYDGTTANAAAVEQPPHLATIIPVSAISRWWGYAYQQGARWVYSGETADIDPPSDTPADFETAYSLVPPPDRVDNADQIAMRWNLCNKVEHMLRGYTGPDFDEFWAERDYLSLAHKVNVPVLVAHGLRDPNVKPSQGTEWFRALTTTKRLVAGGWTHQYPADAQFRFYLDRWLDHWLKGIDNGITDGASARVAGNSGGFREQSDWGGSAPTTFALPDESFTFLDDGLVTETDMLAGRGEDTRWTRVAVPGSAGARIEGAGRVHLSMTSDSPSTHVAVLLCSTNADGVCTPVTRGFLNARYRESISHARDVQPGVPFTATVNLIDTDFIVPAGDQLELFVASSSATWIASDPARATNAIDFGASFLELPLR